MKNTADQPWAPYEAHFETLLRRVAHRRSLTREMDWLFDSSNTLSVTPDYLEPWTVGNNRLEQTLNRSLYRLSENLWFRLFWARIRNGLIRYTRSTYFPIFFQKTARTAQIEESQYQALAAIESFLGRKWDGLGHCTFNEVAVMVAEVVNTWYRTLGCPEDVFAKEKQWQNQASLKLLTKYSGELSSFPRLFELLVYGACQSNWIDILEEGTAQILQNMDEEFGRMLADPSRLDHLTNGNPYYRINRFKSIISGEPKQILFESDNCGEVVFDLMLIQYLVESGHHVVLGAKARPALNDSIVQDIEALLGEKLFAPLSSALAEGRLVLLPIPHVIGGKLIYEATDEYKQAYGEADFLILKGQANFQCMHMGIRRGGRFTPYRYKKPMVFIMPVKSIMSRLCLNSILTPHPVDRSLFLYFFDPFDRTTYP